MNVEMSRELEEKEDYYAIIAALVNILGDR